MASARAFRGWIVLTAAVSALGTATVTLPSALGTTAAAAATGPAAAPSPPARTPARSQLAIAACASASSYVDIAGQGPVCQSNGSWVMRFGRSGTPHTVSAPDLASVLTSTPAPGTHAAVAALSSQQCVDTSTHPHIELYYAHFSDQPDNYSAHAADIQQMFRDVDGNYINYDSTTYFGVGAHLFVECDGSGNPAVHDIALSTPLGATNFSAIANDMVNQGHSNALAHYWIWTDGNPLAAYGYAGQSTIQEDDTPDASNLINSSYQFSVNYGFTSASNGAQVFAHENGHAMGAVQLSAPDSTGLWHCTDGYDVMCYNDGGPRAGLYHNTVCAPAPNGTLIFDCNFNDYFNPGPAAGSYLATHWNLAGANDHWLYLVPTSSSTAVSLSATSTLYSQPVTITATAWTGNVPNPGLPTGSVTFYDGSTALGTSTLTNAVATLTTASLSMGSHTISATYSGSSAYSSSSGAAALSVSRASSVTAVTTAANPAPVNAPLDITATVSAQAPATGTPTGSVTLYDGSTQLGSGTLDGSGRLTLSQTLSYGPHQLSAVYSGDANFAGSDNQSTPVAETVLFPTSTSVNGGSTQAVEIGTQLTFNASVSEGSGVPSGQAAPSGSITFKDGSVVLGTVPLSGNQASLTTTGVLPGTTQVTAVYSGDSAFVPSTGSVSQTVNAFRALDELDGYGGVHQLAPGQTAGQPAWPDWNIARGIALRSDGTSGYVLDAFGGLHGFGGAPWIPQGSLWPGWGIARGIALRPDGQSGYILDGWGGVTPFGGAPNVVVSAYWAHWDIARGIVLRADGQSGFVLDGWGGVHPFGVSGDIPPTPAISGYWARWDIARAIALDPDGLGGYVLDGWGGLHQFGNAPAVAKTGYWYGWDIARALVLLPGGGHMGYVQDGWGGLHEFGGAPALTVPPTSYFAGKDIAHGVALE
ncbi:MAG: Ig-like domain repeat protein [Candidatus Dormibacteraeota bacterium]|nr:Ig-like domain repeat protein [Candidatus Dormibacteraeota bacterium]